MKVLDELISHGCILQGREKQAGEILAKHLENVVADAVNSTAKQVVEADVKAE